MAQGHSDWLSRREDEAFRRGMSIERQAARAKNEAFSKVMELLGCDSSTPYEKVPGMVRKLLERIDNGS